MHGQRRFDVIAEQVAANSAAVPTLLLDCTLRIRAVNTAYERVALRERGELIGQFLFDAFPDDPNDPQASGTSNVAASLETAMRSGHTHKMWIQRYDIRDPAAPDTFLPRVWSPSNSPLFDHGELVGVVHRVEEITELRGALAVMARAVDSDKSWSCADVLHTLAGVSAAEYARRCEEQAVVAENEQLRHAIDTRDTIGQAKGMLMERFHVDATVASNMLVRLSRNMNSRVEQVAHKLIETNHPPRSS